MQIDEGYPAKLRTKPTVHLFDPKAMDGAGRPLWKAGPGGYSHPNQLLGTDAPGKIRLVYATGPPSSASAVGDRFVLRGIGGFSFPVSGCANVTFSKLTLENNGLYGIVEFRCVATNYLGCHITYGPLSCLYGSLGPDIENCVIEGTPDDSIHHTRRLRDDRPGTARQRRRTGCGEFPWRAEFRRRRRDTNSGRS